MKLGAIEAGGTKFVCATGDEKLNIDKRVAFPTTTPEETLARTIAFFKENPVDALGIGSFGPIDLKPESATYGYVTSTPKPGWANTDFLGTLRSALAIPAAWTTDVNEAAFGEMTLGASQADDTSIYVTIGTGIGAGVVNRHALYVGRTHPEVGHFILHRQLDDTMVSTCPYHENCAEGLAAGPAVNKRAGMAAKDVPADDPLWTIEANYIAQLCVDLTLAFAPDKIILNGGVMHQTQLFELVRREFAELLNDYVNTPPLTEYIVPAGLGEESGVIGGLALARETLQSN
jgi:fructokinase